MTRAEILNCLTDRPCDSCKFHESGRCERWNCVFEEKPDDCEDTDNYENEIADLQNRLDIAEYDNERWKEKVTVLDEKLKALSAEPCEDAIRRRAVLDLIEHYNSDGLCSAFYGGVKFTDAVNNLPSVTPKQKMGHWEWLTEDKYRCSNCNHETRVDECMNKPLYDFCPFCGAKMEVSENG